MSQIQEENVYSTEGLNVLAPKTNTLEEFATVVNNDPSAVDLYELEMKRSSREVPSSTAIQASKNINRTQQSSGKGLYQIAIQAERAALKAGLTKHASAIGISAQDLQQMVDYLPNARMAYLNKLIKIALLGIAKGTKTVTPADIRYIRFMNTLNDQAKATLITLLTKSLDSTKDGYSVLPPPTKSSIPLEDAPGIQTGSYIKLKNPGNVYMPIKEADIDTTLPEELLKIIDEKLQRLYDEALLERDVSPLFNIDGFNELSKTLLFFRDKLLDRHITYKQVLEMNEAISRFVGSRRSRYLLSLAQPFKHRNARIPTLISPPSATFSLRSIASLTTNASGNVAFAWNPYWLALSGSLQSTLGINNNAALTGAGASNFFLSTSYGATLPADFYVRFRLVSAGLKIYVFPSSNNDNGMLTTSVTFEELGTAAFGAPIANMAQFGDFLQIENGYFKQTTTIASRDVQEHSYIPIDESFWDYVNLQTGAPKNGFAWTGYITGATPSASIARLELIANYECLLDNQYTDYLPSESPTAEVDPKYVIGVINQMKQSDTLTPKSMEQVLKQQNMQITPDAEIELPISAKMRAPKVEVAKELSEAVKSIVRETAQRMPTVDRQGWLAKVMDMVSPIAASIIQSVNPFTSLPFFK